MIQVKKPKKAPDVLRTKGKTLRDRHCDEYLKHKTDYDNGKLRFQFDSTVYRHRQVKQALEAAQHDKCCFCETKISAITYGDVEHFRPKGGYKQKGGDRLGHPGYYWLAYDWENLFLCCEKCNRYYKKSLFPLKEPEKRALTHQDDIARESPLFLCPTERVEDHITFRGDLAESLNGSVRGQVTIKKIGLNRPALQEGRKDLLEKLRLVQELASVPYVEPSLKKRMTELLSRSVCDDAEYAGMARCCLEECLR